MNTFTDSVGRPWRIELDAAAIDRVCVGADGHPVLVVIAAAIGPMIEADRSIANPIALCDILYRVMEPQAKQAGVSEESFGEGMAGEVLWDAAAALLAAAATLAPTEGPIDPPGSIVEVRHEIEAGNVTRAAQIVHLAATVMMLETSNSKKRAR